MDGHMCMSAFRVYKSPEPAIPTIYRWTRRIDELAAAWAVCFGDHNALRSHALQAAVETAALPDVETHYLVGEDDRGWACLVPCFSFRVSIFAVSSPRIQRIIMRIRAVFPGFLYLRVFVVGSPISNYGDLLGLGPTDCDVRWDAPRLARLFEEIAHRARSLGIGIVLIKEPETTLTNRLRTALGDRFFWADSLPSTYLALPDLARGGYLGAISSRYRNKLKKRKAVGIDNQLTWEVSPTCRGREDEVFSLYQQVLEHSPVVFERLNRDFFPAVERHLGDRAFFLFGYRAISEERRLVACELVLIDRDTLHPLYSGFDYWIKKDASLYFNSFYRLIEEAEKRGLRGIHFGQTAYEVKAELGASCQPLFVGVHHRNRLVHSCLRALQSLLFPPTIFPVREVFGQPPTPPKNSRRPQAATSTPPPL